MVLFVLRIEPDSDYMRAKVKHFFGLELVF
jgi:hypothetical protein